MVRDLVGLVSKELMKTEGNQFLSGGLVLGMLGGAVAMLRRVPSQLWGLFLRKCTISIDVMNTDDTFTWVMLWLHQLPYTKKARRLSFKYNKGKSFLTPSMGNHFFLWHGRPVWTNWIDEDGKTASMGMYSGMMQTRQKITIRILGRSRKPIERMIEEAKKLVRVRSSRKLKLYRRAEGSDWDYELRDPRSLKTVFLPKSADGLLEDMQQFIGNKRWYRKRGIPYRRGYLFYGPPGTGKSSAALAFASELKLPLYTLNLGSIKEDIVLERCICNIDTSSPVVLLIEDIDTAVPSRKGNRDKNLFNLGTLLNAMDGVAARENVILIVTTNKKDSLDPALVRPGRIDKLVEFGLASTDQIRAATQLFFPEGNPDLEAELICKSGSISTADLQETLVKRSER